MRLVDQARACERRGQSAEARALYERALAGMAPPADSAFAGEIARWIGRTYAADGDVSAGLDCAELALAIAEAHGDAGAAAHALNAMGALHQGRGDLDEAVFLYRRAERLARDAGDGKLIGMLRMNLATIANIRGEFVTALEEYGQCLVEFRATRSDDLLGYALNNMGMLYSDLGRWSEAEAAFSEALRCCERADSVGTKAMVLTNYAEVLAASDKLSEAERLCDEAWRLMPGVADDRAQAELQKVHGAVLRDRGRLGEAEQLLRAAAATAEAREDLLLTAEVLREQALLFAQRDRNQETLRCLNRSHALFERLRARTDIADLGRKIDQLQQTFLAMVRRWGESIESADRYTQGHCVRVADYACLLAREVGMDEQALLWFRMGAMLHDVGKIVVPPEVLNKPGGLTPEERAVIEQHSDAGAALLRDIEFPWDIRPMVRFHHERWVGGGYPTGIAGETIPLPARILAVADVFDALSTDRPYRRALPLEQCLEIMSTSIRGHFDPHLLEVWLELCRSGRVVVGESSAADPAPAAAGSPPRDCVLLVSDCHSAAELEEISTRWGGSGIQYTIVRPWQNAVELAEEEVAAVVAVLRGAPDRCVEFVGHLRAALPRVPLIGVLDHAHDELTLRVVQQGAQECLAGPEPDPELLRRSIRHAIARTRRQYDLHDQSLRDDLTGLYNRRGFLSLAERRKGAAPRYSLRPVLLCVDLDDLKEINDALGHAEGDRALMEVAGALRSVFREADVLARIGGDEFVALTLLPATMTDDSVADRVLEEIARRSTGRGHGLGVSVGVASDPSGTLSLVQLLQAADDATYAQKRRKRARASVAVPPPPLPLPR